MNAFAFHWEEEASEAEVDMERCQDNTVSGHASDWWVVEDLEHEMMTRRVCMLVCVWEHMFLFRLYFLDQWVNGCGSGLHTVADLEVTPRAGPAMRAASMEDLANIANYRCGKRERKKKKEERR